MRKIIGIGESILDIVFKNRQPVSATPGGSVFNGLISLGRLGLPVYFVSDIGQDQVGRFITDFMENNGLSSKYMNLHPDTNTAVALAFLDENNDANYTFYKDYSVKGLQGNFPPINTDDIVIFGSYYALNPLLRKRVKAFLEKAVQKSALIYYDINFRKSHSYQAKALNPVLIENYRYADIIRGSEDDFRALYQKQHAGGIYREKIAPYCDNFIFTAAEKNVEFHCPQFTANFPVKKIPTLSTVGAGDSFNAGILYGLMQSDICRKDLALLDQSDWEKIIALGIDFSAKVCQSYENYIPRPESSNSGVNQ